MTEEMLTIIRDNQDHLIHLYDRRKDAFDEYYKLGEKIRKKEEFLQKLLEQAMPTLAAKNTL